MSHYPHMMAEDTIVWTKFLESEFIKIFEVWYDVRVGNSVLVEGVHDDLTRRIADGLTRKRIDVVARVEGAVWVIEVKPRANMYAIGQVISYQRLFEKEHTVLGGLIPVIICADYDADLVSEFDEFGVLVLKV